MRILAVDDELGFLRLMERACKEAGIACVAASSAEEAVARLRESRPGHFDAVLLDVRMPDVDGWACCAMLREVEPRIRVVFLTGQDAEPEVARGLTVGAEDYIIKPCSYDALRTRLLYLRDRHEKFHSIQAGKLRLDLVNRLAEVDGRPIELTQQEFKMLLELALARGAALSRAVLLERVWHERSDPGTNRVEVHVANLRRKLRSAGIDAIQTVRGAGYALRTPG